MTASREMTLVEHLEELRTRLLVCLGAVAAGSILGWFFAGRLLEWLRRPLPAGGELVMTSLGEGFFAVLRLAVAFGVAAASPVILWQLWAFIAPALDPPQRRWGMAFVGGGLLLFFGGIAFAYYLMLPVAVRFFLAFGSGIVKPLLTLGGYLSFVLTFVLVFGFMFELPVVIFALARLGIVSPRTLRKHRRMAIFIIFTVAAVVSPTVDAVSLLLLALPLWFLYELGLVLAGGWRAAR